MQGRSRVFSLCFATRRAAFYSYAERAQPCVCAWDGLSFSFVFILRDEVRSQYSILLLALLRKKHHWNGDARAKSTACELFANWWYFSPVASLQHVAWFLLLFKESCIITGERGLFVSTFFHEIQEIQLRGCKHCCLNSKQLQFQQHSRR
jgi:hypothetical protein